MGGERPGGTGIPTAAVPPDPSVLTAPAHALRRAATALLTETDRGSAVLAVLHGPGDEPRDWLVAGEALSAGRLAAAELGCRFCR